MAAIIHASFSGPHAPPEPGSAPHPLVGELHAAASEVLNRALCTLFDSADDLLFEMSERAETDIERRRHFDTLRVLRLERDGVLKNFAVALDRGFHEDIPPADALREVEIEALSFQPTEELEEKIAVGNLATKAENLYRSRAWDLDQRLRTAIRVLKLQLPADCLSPARICQALGSAVAGVDTEFEIKLVMYKLLDRVVIREIDRVYDRAFELLDRHGVQAARRGDRGLQPGAPRQQPPIGPAAAEVLRRHRLDEESLGTLAGRGPAHEVAQWMQQLAAREDWNALQAATQRLSMAGRLIDELLSEPLLAAATKPALEGLRHPVYRAALHEAAFFSDDEHPLRRALAEVMQTATLPPTPETPAALQAALQRVLEFQSAMPATAAADTAASPGSTATAAVSADETRAFLQRIREQARQRREAHHAAVRNEVAQELDRAVQGREVPAPVLTLLRGGVAPLMALRLLRQGRGSPAFEQAQQMPKRILESLEFQPPPSTQELEQRELLLSTLVLALRDIGMRDDRVESLLNGLQDVYGLLDLVAPVDEPVAEPRPVIPGEPPASVADSVASAPEEPQLPSVTVMELLSRILRPESWYRVFDAVHEQTRWLKLAGFYPQEDNVVFSGFDESHRLSLRATAFALDVVEGRSEPINPDSLAQESLVQLQRAKARGLF